MVRPRDLPQPVREHSSHETTVERYSCSPGPGAYFKSSVYLQRSKTGGAFSRAARFRQQMAASSEVHPGPVYNPKLSETTLAVSFKGKNVASYSASRHDQATTCPGPGAYHVVTTAVLPSSHGPSFGSGSRDPGGRSASSSCVPGPSTYNPNKPISTRKAAAFFGSGKRGQLFEHGNEGSEQLTSLEGLDRGIQAVRPPVAPSISFSKGVGHNDGASGSRTKDSFAPAPGHYHVSDDAVRPHSRGTTFLSSPRLQDLSEAAEHRSFRCVSASTALFQQISTKSSAPSVGFSKAPRTPAFGGGSRSESAMGTSCAPSATVSYAQIDPSVRLCVAWKGSSRPSSASAIPSAPPFIAAPSSIGQGPAVSFTKAPREDARGLKPSIPGPGAYDPTPKRRPESASRSIGKAPRVMTFGSDRDDTTDAPLYIPTDSLTKPTAPCISMPREGRVRPVSAPSRRGDDIPSGLDYNPSYTHVDRGPHAAVLYLTG